MRYAVSNDAGAVPEGIAILLVLRHYTALNSDAQLEDALIDP